jgi:uncharacterized oxidoreductase
MTSRAQETVFITGGTSGIGEGLARAFHARGATVIISGRDETALRRISQECPGMNTAVLDVTDPEAVLACAQDIGTRFPDLNLVINNAGIQRLIDFRTDVSLDDLGTEVDTNLKGLLYVTAAFLPLLRRQQTARLVQVGSGLGYVPLVRAPVYSATKAAVHAFTVALREQLRGGPVQIVALVPPVVTTQLHRHQDRPPARAMTLKAFVDAAMKGLDGGQDEVAVGLARVLRIGVRVAPGRFLNIVNTAR